MIRQRQASLGDQVFDQLEMDILSGTLARDSIVTEKELAEHLGVSRTPVREAITRLEQENMVEDLGKGIRIVGITDSEAEYIYVIREKLEGMAAAEAAVHITDEQLTAMKDILDYHEFLLEKGDTEKMRECDNEFHELLYKSSDNAVLISILVPLHRKVQRYRKMTIRKKDRAAQSIREHIKIYEALKLHNPGLAELAATDHVMNAKASVSKNLQDAKEA